MWSSPGDYFTQPRAAIRPEPFKSFRGRTYAAAVSPESARIMAELGIGLLVIPQKPWEHVERGIRRVQGALSRGQRRAGTEADLRHLDHRRRGRKAGRGTRAALYRRLLAERPRPL